MRATVIWLAALAACGFRHGSAADDAAPLGGDGMRDAPADGPPDAFVVPGNGFDKAITVQRGMVVGDVTGFPVWISLTNDADLIAHARGDHSDVYFTDVSGAAIAYEITGWDRPSGTLQAWVRVAHLTPSTQNPDPNVIHLRFGGPDAPLASNGAAVFDNGFAAVWHLETSATTVVDATGMTPGMLSGSAPTTGGQLGNGLVFSGMATSVTFTSPITGAGSSTMSAWIDEATPVAGVYSYSILVLGTASADHARWFYSRHGGYQSSISAGLYSDDHVPSPADVLATGAWTKVDWVYDAGNRGSHLYVNGNEVGSGATLGTASTTGPAGMFANAPVAYQTYGPTAFDGVLDEVRISNGVRSSNWLKIEYANQHDPGSFYNVGGVTAL